MGQPPGLSSQLINQRIESFVLRQGWSGAEKTYLAGDFSGRFYVRLRRGLGEGARALVMCMPQTKDLEDFTTMQRLLYDYGVRVPAIYAIDRLEDLALIEDLGDASFSNLAPADMPRFTRAAIDVLLRLHARAKGPVLEKLDIPAFNPSRFTDQVSLLLDMLEAVVLKASLTPQERADFLTLWPSLLHTACDEVPKSLLLRDYHAANIMVLKTDPPELAVIDFQDGGVGPITYDIVSLLEDARRDMDAAARQDLLEYYCRASPEVSPESFMRSYHVMAAQRHLRIMAVTARRWAKQGDAHALAYYRRSWRLLENHRREEILAPLFVWLDSHAPEKYRQDWEG